MPGCFQAHTSKPAATLQFTRNLHAPFLHHNKHKTTGNKHRRSSVSHLYPMRTVNSITIYQFLTEMGWSLRNIWYWMFDQSLLWNVEPSRSHQIGRPCTINLFMTTGTKRASLRLLYVMRCVENLQHLLKNWTRLVTEGKPFDMWSIVAKTIDMSCLSLQFLDTIRSADTGTTIRLHFWL